MKLKIMSLVAAIALLATSCGTTYTSTSDNAAYNVNVPIGIRSNFAVAYPDATDVVWNSYNPVTTPIDWELAGWQALDTDDFTVTFNMGNDVYHAFYDSDGTLVGTTYEITDYTRLPYSVHTMLQERYKGFTIHSVQRENVGTRTAYEVKLKNDQDDAKVKLLVDANGNILKEKYKD